MKDIDFDELDRAVNSLIGDKPTESPAPPAEATTPPAASLPATPTPAAPLAARRSSGRFMDVVHPSSDMRTSPTPAQTALPSREGLTIQPSSATVPDSTATSTDALDDQVAPSSEPSATEATETISSIGDRVIEPLESPFLSDAKVEKRPLGAFSDESSAPAALPTEAEPELSSTELEQTDDDRSDHPIETDTPMPAELQDDVLSIESNEDAEPPVSSTAENNNSTALDTPEVPAGPTSIVQQYAEEVSTSDQPTGTIFDTEAYKKPLSHPKKKGSGWLLVLWIFLLLVVGAGAGAAVYFYVLPLL